ncbi:MAG: FecR domain-containing protein [Candidatus Cloacimonetes bacterium]|nr:FecR domain-containing protein [Candidatus Cloacimonadota bacterium]
MKKKIYIIVSLLILIGVMSAQETIALIMKVQGSVNLEREGVAVKLENGSLLSAGDRLMTGKDSYAALKFIDGGAIIKLFPESDLVLNASKEDNLLNKESTLWKGGVFSKVERKLGKYSIETPTAIASVKGTEFLTQVGENGETDIYAIKGILEFKNRNDTNSIELKNGNKAHSLGRGIIEVQEFSYSDLPQDITQYIDEGSSTEKLEIDFINKYKMKKKLIIELE